MLTVETPLMVLSGDINNMIPQTSVFVEGLLATQPEILRLTAFLSLTLPKLLDIQTLNLALLITTPRQRS